MNRLLFKIGLTALWRQVRLCLYETTGRLAHSVIPPEKASLMARRRLKNSEATEFDTAGPRRVAETGGQEAAHTESRLRTAEDVLDMLNELVATIRDAPDLRTLEKVQCIRQLAPVMLRAIETFDLQVRLEAVEATLKLRSKRKT